MNFMYLRDQLIAKLKINKFTFNYERITWAIKIMTSFTVNYEQLINNDFYFTKSI